MTTILDKIFHRTPPAPLSQAEVDGFQRRLHDAAPEEPHEHLTQGAQYFRDDNLLQAEGAMSRANDYVHDVTQQSAPLFTSDRVAHKIFGQQATYLERIPGEVGETVRAIAKGVPSAGAAAFRYSAFDDVMTTAQRTQWATRLDEVAAQVLRFA